MEEDNFDDNGFAWFEQYKNAKPGEPLYDKGMVRSNSLIDEWTNDVNNNSIPQVSILIAPTWLSEHATNHPQDGEELSSVLIQTLVNNKELYSKSLFILNYDEGGGFFDHHWVPTPPRNHNDGISTVSTHGELTHMVTEGIPEGYPIGFGFRVPLLLISPWTRGGYVFSEISDHISTIKLLERRFNFKCETISEWRRAVSSDLTNALNFDNPDFSLPTLPSTNGSWDKSKHQCDDNPPPKIPKHQKFPHQEKGIKKSFALP